MHKKGGNLNSEEIIENWAEIIEPEKHSKISFSKWKTTTWNEIYIEAGRQLVVGYFMYLIGVAWSNCMEYYLIS